MIEAGHTPGPWFYHEPVNRNRRDFGVTAMRPYDPSIGAVRRIAWVGNSSNYNNDLADEIRANARLIAAAPDLLAALKAMMSGLTNGPDSYAIWKQAEAAIAKAEAAA